MKNFLKMKKLPWAKDEKFFAEKYLSDECGPLHLNWAIDHYWGLVTRDIIIPSSLAIYNVLVEKNYTEKKRFEYNDLDNTAFYIPCPNKKVWVETTQSRDFLYIMDDHGAPNFNFIDLHVRRIYRDLKKNSYLMSELKGASANELFRKMLQNVDSLSEYHDDHYQYSHRPSLKVYQETNFQIPFHGSGRGRIFYGDFRDPGYILSYNSISPRVEGSVMSFHTLEHIATLYLPCLASDLGIKVPQLKGYED